MIKGEKAHLLTFQFYRPCIHFILLYISHSYLLIIFLSSPWTHHRKSHRYRYERTNKNETCNHHARLKDESFQSDPREQIILQRIVCIVSLRHEWHDVNVGVWPWRLARKVTCIQHEELIEGLQFVRARLGKGGGAYRANIPIDLLFSRYFCSRNERSVIYWLLDAAQKKKLFRARDYSCEITEIDKMRIPKLGWRRCLLDLTAMNDWKLRKARGY